MNDVSGKFNTLSLGEKLIVVGAVLMLIASLFFDWYHISIDGLGSAGYSGWGDPGSIWSVLAVVISVALGGIVAATRFGNMAMPALPAGWTWGMVFGGGAALVVLFMLLKAWRISDVPVGGFGIGFWLGVIATGMIAYGGYLLYSADRGAGFGGLMKK